MKRTKLKDRRLPDYTRAEERFNMISHIAGGAFGLAALSCCVTAAALRQNIPGLVGGIIYGVMTIFLYTMSSLYHGLTRERPKKVLQVLDHCTIYAMILGTYAPILLTGLYRYDPRRTLILTVVVLLGAAVGVTFTAIDFKRYKILAYGGYFAVGWCVIFSSRALIAAFGLPFFLWLLSGGIVYTIGIVFYIIGMRRRFFHSIFHLFILAGSILQFIGIFQGCILTAY